MTDNRIKDRVKGLLAVTPTSGDIPVQAHPQGHPPVPVQGPAQGPKPPADGVRAAAREAAAQVTREARAAAEEAQREADKILSDAQAKAEAVAADARANADELKLQAEQKYDDVVGSLAGKREALQEQIEALEVFDREYRARLQSFMQTQLRALWVDEPKVSGEVDA